MFSSKLNCYIVPPLAKPERLDKFLLAQFPHTHRSYWRKNLSRSVLLEGKTAKKGMLVFGGEELCFLSSPPVERPALLPNAALPLTLLYEDPFLFAADKIAGLSCYPLADEENSTMVNAVVARFPEQAKIGNASWPAGLLHRLDRETSGVLLFAKSEDALEKMKALQRENKILKTYLAWVEGTLSSAGKIDFSIAHHPKNRRKMVIFDEKREKKPAQARAAQTRYEVLESNPEASLLRLEILRGSRHQIRVHLAAIGHPIVGDALYGERKAQLGTRLLLHAWKVEFFHPLFNRNISIESRPPKDFHMSI